MCSYVFFGFWDQHFCRLGPMSNDLACIFLRWRMSISIWWFPECGYHQIIQVIRPWLGIECYGFGVPTFWETSNLWQKRKQLNNKPTQTFLTLMRLFAPPRINWHHIAAWPSEPQKIPLSHLIKKLLVTSWLKTVSLLWVFILSKFGNISPHKATNQSSVLNYYPHMFDGNMLQPL